MSTKSFAFRRKEESSLNGAQY